jgi:succinate dehydrogenase hydrophobic anchor subunit
MKTAFRRALGRIKFERVLARVDHFAAWGSAVLLILYVISGYGLTRPARVTDLTGGIVAPRLAFTLHNNLYIPLLVLFAFHTFVGLRRALIRTTRRKAIAGWVAVGAGAIVVTYLALLGFA